LFKKLALNVRKKEMHALQLAKFPALFIQTIEKLYHALW